VRTTRQFRVFVVLTAMLVLAFLALGWVRWRGQAPEREAWAAIQGEIAVGAIRIDSLKQVLARMDDRLTREKRALASASERLRHWERQAVGGRLPTPQHRQYLGEIDRHNEAVSAHNAVLVEMQRVYARYSALVDTHNARVDSANVLQRRAVQEGIQLAVPER
jgi:hypothetical protein